MNFDWLNSLTDTFVTDGIDGVSALMESSPDIFVATEPLESSAFDVTTFADKLDSAMPFGTVDEPLDMSALPKSTPTGLLSTVSGWVKENPKLAELLLKGAGGAWAAGKAGSNALASTKLQEEIANRKRERIQQSIMGMSEMPRGNASPLTRLNGARVYNDKGGLA